MRTSPHCKLAVAAAAALAVDAGGVSALRTAASTGLPSGAGAAPTPALFMSAQNAAPAVQC
jgi:hypothetical protein